MKKAIKLRRNKKFGVGKTVGSCIYVHRQYEWVLPECVQQAKTLIPTAFPYTVVKFDQRTTAVSFIESPDFDTADEPTVGSSYHVEAKGWVTFRKSNGAQIYHHKWLFVKDDYAGFDVAAARRRSLQWMALEGVDRRRIGSRKYWKQNVVSRIEIEDRLRRAPHSKDNKK
jgi:hypothetical protein